MGLYMSRDGIKGMITHSMYNINKQIKKKGCSLVIYIFLIISSVATNKVMFFFSYFVNFLMGMNKLSFDNCRLVVADVVRWWI